MGNVQLAHANSAKDVRNLINAGSFQQAIDTANQKLSQNPKNLQLLLLKGQALVKLKKHKEADELYKGILKSFPKNPGAPKWTSEYCNFWKIAMKKLFKSIKK